VRARTLPDLRREVVAASNSAAGDSAALFDPLLSWLHSYFLYLTDWGGDLGRGRYKVVRENDLERTL